MEQQKDFDTGKTSFLKLWWNLTKFKLGIIKEFPKELQRAMLVFMSLKNFKKFAPSFEKIALENMYQLLDPRNAQKFEYIIKDASYCPWEFLEVVLKNGSKEQICLMLQHQELFVNQEKILLELNDEQYFHTYFAHFELSAFTLLGLIQQGNDTILKYYINDHPEISLPWDVQAALFSSKLDEVISLYASVGKNFNPTAQRWILTYHLDREKVDNMLRNCVFEQSADMVDLLFAYQEDGLIKSFYNSITCNGNKTVDVITDYAQICLVKYGNVDIIQQLVDDNIVFCIEAEEELVKLQNWDLLYHYIETTDEPLWNANAALYINTAPETYKNDYIEQYGLPYTLEIEFIQSGEYDKISEYIGKHAFHSTNAALFIKNAPVNIVQCYTQKYHLSPLAETELFQRFDCNHGIIRDYVRKLISEKRGLTERNEIFFSKTCGVWDLLNDYVLSRRNVLCKKSLFALLNRGHIHNVADIIRNYQVYCKILANDVLDFVKKGNRKSLLALIDILQLNDDAEIALILRHDKDLFLTYIEHNGLSKNAEVSLFDINKTDKKALDFLTSILEICFEKYSLNEVSEVKFVEMFYGKPLFDTYVKKHKLSSEAEKALADII